MTDTTTPTTPTTPASDLSPYLAEVTEDNVIAACGLAVAPEQRTFVAPVERSLAEAYAARDTAWVRLVMEGDEIVGFVMANFAPEESDPDFRCGLWRLAVAEGRQGRGYGRFAVEGFLAQARARGVERVTVMWVEGEGGPADFYRKLGFETTGRVLDGETVAELYLN
ncbi:diamine N-acetyltransferase [Nocardiopsis sp. Huas11]|uniref:GNAT family N-acetyltransferase n=1 Tax=Nocardiopsis sp. Huas11 TaxID=2183912 RepID=UPI000EAFEFEC|nr:GNAT family N-acetyltransferase [Nocardiopsis sp. Huas11]RKS09101.1 diamine N-acetyltransferase [Nocardiopsis sp. Huas11]